MEQNRDVLILAEWTQDALIQETVDWIDENIECLGGVQYQKIVDRLHSFVHELTPLILLTSQSKESAPAQRTA